MAKIQNKITEKITKQNIGDLSFVVTTNTILLGIFFIALIWFIFQIKLIVLSLFVAIILALSLEPIVEWLMKKKMPKVPAVILTMISVVSVLFILTFVALIPMVQHTNLPSILESYSGLPQYNSFLTELNSQISTGKNFSSSGDGVKFVFGALGNIGSGAILIVTTLITIIFFTTYLLLDFNNFRTLVINLFPPKHRKTLGILLIEIESKLGMWLRGQIILMFAVGLLTYLGLYVIQLFVGDVPYLESIALIAGLLEVVPLIGPIFAAIIGGILGFSNSVVVGISIVILFIIIQQAENSILVPKVMEKAVGFRPIVTMVAILAGGQIFGIMGALLAVPVSLIISIIFKYIYSTDKSV
jgi:predicted PurR-regulated permease PerM